MKKSEYHNKQPDSPKGLVYACFINKGEDAARKLGAKLEIKASRVNGWLKHGFQHVVEKQKAAAAARAEEAAKPKKSAKPKKVPAKPTTKKKPAPKSAQQQHAAAAA